MKKKLTLCSPRACSVRFDRSEFELKNAFSLLRSLSAPSLHRVVTPRDGGRAL